MTHKEIDEEFSLLSEYLTIYIQLLPYCVQCGGKVIHKPQMPLFEYFKNTYNDERYSLAKPNYKESKTVYDNDKIVPVYTRGMGSENGIAYRFYNYWMHCVFFTGNNLEGNYTIDRSALNDALKKM